MGRVPEEGLEIMQPLTQQSAKPHIRINDVAGHFTTHFAVALEGVVTRMKLFAAVMKSKLRICNLLVQTNVKNLGGITLLWPQGKGFVVKENTGYLAFRVIHITKNHRATRAGVHANRCQATGYPYNAEVTLVRDIAWIPWITTMFR